MQVKIGKRVPYGVLLMLACCTGAVATAGEPRLTESQSLALVFAQGETASLEQAYRLADPAVKSSLYRILGDDTLSSRHACVARILGWIGDASDVPRLQEYLKTHFKSPISADGYHSINAMTYAVGIMAWRNVDGADRLLDTMTYAGFWKDIPLHTSGGRYDDVATGVVHQMVFDVLLQVQSNGGDWRPKATRYVSDAPGVKDPARFKERLFADITHYEKTSVETRKRLQQEPHVSTRLREELTSLSPASPTTSPSTMPSGMGTANQPVSSVQRNESERECVPAAVAWDTAWQQFNEIKERLITTGPDTVIDRVVDNGRLPTLGEMARKKPKLLRDLNFEKELLQRSVMRDMKIAGVMLAMPNGKRIALDSRDAASKVDVSRDEDIIISFRLRGTNEVTAVAPFQRMRNTATVSADGSLQVVMCRITGKWYWNPFGW